MFADKLVFDIGLHNGDDTAYYLARGYDVVAVEANPDFCAEARERFADELAAGRLTIRNIGIAEQEGELTFWVSERSQWSSFDKALATRIGVLASPIEVRTIRFSELVNQYGQALYIKIDIEGKDTECVHELESCKLLPHYISFEAHPRAADDIELLAKLGYSRFKLIRQNDWLEITPENIRWRNFARRIRSSYLTQRYKFIEDCLRVAYYRNRRPRFPNPYGSSGPLAWELPGRWLNCTEILTVVERYVAPGNKLQAGPLGEWFDIAASRTAES
jgi:FkbM family methyltransferase